MEPRSSITRGDGEADAPEPFEEAVVGAPVEGLAGGRRHRGFDRGRQVAEDVTVWAEVERVPVPRRRHVARVPVTEPFVML